MAALSPHPALGRRLSGVARRSVSGRRFSYNGAFRLSYGFDCSAMLETGDRELSLPVDRADTTTILLGRF
jgi:hypothetical protein